MYLSHSPPWLQWLYPSLTWHKSRKEKSVYLTFDDGPIPVVTPFVLNTLKNFNARATFFCIGDNAAKFPDLYSDLISSGHTVGNHTFNHLKGWNTANKDYLSNIAKCSELIPSNLFRPPYGKIKKSLGKVGFCEYIIESPRAKFKLWGGPDTFEMGDDGVPEVVDYKYHEDPQKGAERLDMDLTPKLYTLLSSEQLKKMGYNRARFIIRQWTDPSNTTLFTDFDLDDLGEVVKQIKQKIEIILNNKSVSFCERSFCRACKSEKRQEYLRELEEKKMVLLSTDVLFAP